MKRKSVRRKPSEALALAQALSLTPLILAMRVPVIAAECAGTALGRAETSRALSEKCNAFVDGAAAAQIALARSALMFWPDVMSGRTPTIFSGEALQGALTASARPMAKTLRANYRRLTSRK